jgi:multicomponent Na+:H+ antiporter subunit G
MATILTLLALASKLVGVVFLFAAALGVMRFEDTLQRMHAATKAGTVGAIFVMLGVVLQMQRTDATVVGLAAIAFLLITIPVAGHLLARATYVSGGSISGLTGEDALKGVLPREERPLEERIFAQLASQAEEEREVERRHAQRR